MLGSWFVASLEDGRRSRVTQTWEDSTSWKEANGRIYLTGHLDSLIEYISLSILDPSSLHDDIHPAPVSAPAPKKGKFVLPTETLDEEDAVDHERLARYRVGGLVGLTRIVQNCHSTPALLELLRNPILWSALSPEPAEDAPNIGVEQPAIRKSAYVLLDAFIEAYPEEMTASGKQLSVAVHGSCWFEKDATVWQQAGQALVKFLSSEF